MLNLGCGSVRPKAWTNTDSSLNANLQKIPFIGKPFAKLFNPVQYSESNFEYMNLNKTWKYKDNCVDVVYASHLFEHLSLNSTEVFLNEAFRCLKPGGVVRIVVPDLYKICKRYIHDYEHNSFNNESTEFILWAINMHREGQYGNPGLIKKMILELQGYPHQHKYMYDEKSLSKRIQAHGFTNILSMTYGKSEYLKDCIGDVEGTAESYLSVYIEAIKN